MSKKKSTDKPSTGSGQTPEEKATEAKEAMVHKIHIDGMYESWFLDYASYVILERAVPTISDGLKPVQRRILHALKEIDDGRFNKVANVIGQTMQYHPHGDAAIGDAMVNLGQKNLLIETQGNWGDVRTGDRSAAPRYIEARLSKFALDVVFNPSNTEWQLSYDGRKREPVSLPVKFPLLLAQGAEGIAVGLATKIMPHNFNELIKASINHLKGKNFTLVPDFPTGGLADFTNYNDGKRGGKIRVRASIEALDKRTLSINNIPFGTTTTSLIESILKANENKKIKISSVADNTAADVEIRIELPSGVSPDLTIDALYAFTDCEMSISPNACVIVESKPVFMGVTEILATSTEHTKDLLKRELEITLASLEEKWHFASLEQIFIENRIYRDIEECETWEAVIDTIGKGLKPFIKNLKREITEEDIVRLTEIKIKRISKFDSFKANEEIKKLDAEMKRCRHDLKHLTDYAIKYFEGLYDKYGKGRDRKTLIKTFDTIQVRQVAVANQKLYVNRKEGFVGYGLKKDELISECSDLDDIIVIQRNGKFKVIKVADKTFVGKDIIHTAVWKKGDDRMVYNLVYLEAKTGRAYAKRFAVTSITRDKEYDLTKGAAGSRLLYFSANPNSESEIVSVQLSPNATARNKGFEYDFGELAIKGRGSQGNILTRHPVKKIERKELGASTLGGRDIWLDDTVGRLNTVERGNYLGNFNTNDNILVLHKDGSYSLTDFELTNRYEMDELLHIEKLDPEVVISAVYYDGVKKSHFVKRFGIETSKLGVKQVYITEDKDSKLVVATTGKFPYIEFNYEKGKQKEKLSEQINLTEFIDVKGWKAGGNKLLYNRITAMKLAEVELAEHVIEDANSGQEAEVKTEAESENPETKKPKEPLEAKAEKSSSRQASKTKKQAASAKKDTLEPGTEIELDVSPKKGAKKKKPGKDDPQASLF